MPCYPTDPLPSDHDQSLTPRYTVGQDATEAFYGLHRHEVLERPQYARLQIGTIKDEKATIVSKVPGELSQVPYAEPTWLTQGYHSPYFKEVSATDSGSWCITLY